MRRRAVTGSIAYSFLARLGATRGGSSGCLGYSGGHGASCSPSARSCAAIVQQRLERLGLVGDPRPRVAATPDQIGDRPDGQLLRLDRVDLIPAQRGRDLAPDPGPCEPGAEDRLVWGILIEVDEDPLSPLLLPPLGRDQVRVPALELAGQGHRAGTDLEAVPAGFEPDVDVEAPVPGRLGVADDAQLVEQRSARDRPPPGSRRMRYPAGDRGRCGAHRRVRGRRHGRATGGGRGTRG